MTSSYSHSHSSDMLLYVTGKSKEGKSFTTHFVPKKNIMNHLEKDGKTVNLKHFNESYTCPGMLKKGFVVEKVTLVTEFVLSGPFTLSGISTADFDCGEEW